MHLIKRVWLKRFLICLDSCIIIIIRRLLQSYHYYASPNVVCFCFYFFIIIFFFLNAAKRQQSKFRLHAILVLNVLGVLSVSRVSFVWIDVHCVRFGMFEIHICHICYANHTKSGCLLNWIVSFAFFFFFFAQCQLHHICFITIIIKKTYTHRKHVYRSLGYIDACVHLT